MLVKPVVFLAWPKTMEITKWSMACQGSFKIASPHTDNQEALWWSDIKNRSFKDLASVHHPRFERCDEAIRGAFKKMCEEAPKDASCTAGVFWNEVQERDLEIQRQDPSAELKGRQMAWLFFKHFETTSFQMTTFGWAQLFKLRWLGDDRMAEFLKQWDDIINHMLEHFVFISQRMVFGCFMAMWKQSVVLNWSVKHMEQMGAGSRDYSYKYMRGTIVQYLQGSQEARIDAERAKEVRQGANKQGGQNAAPVLGDEGKKKKKGKR